MLPLAVYGYFQNGSSIAYICRVANNKPAGQPARRALPAADRALGLPAVVTSIDPDADITVVVETTDQGNDESEGPAPFTITIVENGQPVETFPNLTLSAGDRNATKVINATSTKVKIDIQLDKGADLSAMLDVMKPGSYALEKAPPAPGTEVTTVFMRGAYDPKTNAVAIPYYGTTPMYVVENVAPGTAYIDFLNAAITPAAGEVSSIRPIITRVGHLMRDAKFTGSKYRPTSMVFLFGSAPQPRQ